MIAYNPTAGRFPSRLLAERAANVLRGQGWQVHLEQSTTGEDITRLAQQAVQDGMDALFMAGGDGSINRAVAGLIDSETALGVLPAGTSNVFAQELNLPVLRYTRLTALEECARLLTNARIRLVDVGLVNDRPFVLWAGVGLDAFIVHRIEPRNRLEKHLSVVTYGSSVVWYASFWRGMNIAVEADGNRISGHYLLGLVSNVRLYAGGLATLSESACLDDGIMDLWLFEGETLGDTVQFALELLSGRHENSNRVFKFSFKSLRLESGSPTYFELDGEPVTGESPATIYVKQRCLRVLVPEAASPTLFSQDAPL
jgi:diacylglycerol kinase (ATP)